MTFWGQLLLTHGENFNFSIVSVDVWFLLSVRKRKAFPTNTIRLVAVETDVLNLEQRSFSFHKGVCDLVSEVELGLRMSR